MQTRALSSHDAAFGALLGACVGDAAGATLEFLGYAPSEFEVTRAMQMPGGGTWSVAPGQITDDGELTLCLASALAQSRAFPLEAIAKQYAEWVRSAPFDIGSTTSMSLGCYKMMPWKEICETQGYAAAMTSASSRFCTESKANGSLMRATPLGIWGYRLPADELAQYAIQDSSLSHPNRSCCHAVAAYIIAIAHLIHSAGDASGAFDRAQTWARANAVREINEWLDSAVKNAAVPFHPQAGFVRIAFCHAFRHLRLGTNYVDAIQETLEGGGDTDTNACIVGGLIGAACGAEAIPDYMKLPVLACNTAMGRPRPEFLQTEQISDLVARLFAVAPSPDTNTSNADSGTALLAEE